MKKLSIQKIFCFISLLFIFSCCLFYGTRFVKLYLEQSKENDITENTLAKTIKDNNIKNSNFISINSANYFINNSNNNYIKYSNIIWRIIKINPDNSITAISNNSLTSLAYGEKEYKLSYINSWLNKTNEEYTGILENSLNKIDTYLTKTSVCLDEINEVNNNPCTNNNNENYISLLSSNDYATIGAKNNYLINNEYFYLANKTTESKVWYITNDGKLMQNNGSEILGIRPVITIKANIEYVSGNGEENNPYVIEKENALFGSYVKLDNDTWRIYQITDTEVSLVKDNYVSLNNNEITYKYSNISSYSDDYKYGTLSYYLNHDYLNSLSYKNKINESSWSNGYYSTNDFNYINSLNKTIKTKVALLSIGDIILNPELNNYYTMTGTKDKGTMVYTIQQSKKIYAKNISTELKIVPTIKINKDLLKKGNGNKDNPFEME